MNLDAMNETAINDAQWGVFVAIIENDLVINDSGGRWKTQIVSVNAALTMFDEFIKSVIIGGSGGITVTKVMGETIVMADALGNEWVYRRREILDFLTLADSTQFWLRRARVLTEQLTVVDETIKGIKHLVTNSEVIVTTDDAGGAYKRRVVSASEQLTIIDEAVKFLRRVALATDAIAMTDSTIKMLRLVRVIEDDLTLVDSFIKNIVSAGGQIFTQVLGENLIITDAQGHGILARREVIDAITIGDSTLMYKQRVRMAEDDLTVLDQIVFWRRLVRNAIEAATIIDGIVTNIVRAGGINTRIVSDTLDMSDSAGTFKLRVVQASEALVLNDTVIRALARIRYLADSLIIQDGMILVQVKVRNLIDPLTVYDENLRNTIFSYTVPIRIVLGMAKDVLNVLGLDEANVIGQGSTGNVTGFDESNALGASNDITLGVAA